MKLNLNEAVRNVLPEIDKKEAIKIIRSFLPQSILSIEAELTNKKNSFAHIHLSRKAKVFKKSPLFNRIVKDSEFSIQLASYNSLKRVQAKHASGEVEKVGLRPTEFKLSPFLYYNANTDNLSFQIATVNNPNCQRKTEWKRDGQTVDKEAIASELTAYETRESSPSDTLRLNPENVRYFKCGKDLATLL